MYAIKFKESDKVKGLVQLGNIGPFQFLDNDIFIVDKDHIKWLTENGLKFHELTDDELRENGLKTV